MSVLLCWSSDGRGNICGGRLRWRATATGYSSVCSRCKRESKAATGEVRELDALGAEVLDPGREAVVQPTSKPRGVRPGVDLGESRDTTTKGEQ